MRCFRDPDLQARFEREGLVVVDLLPRDAVDRLLSVHAQESQEDQTGFFASMLLAGKEEYRARVDTVVKAEIGPRVLPLLEDFRLFHGSFAIKAPNSEASRIGLHQDISFVDERHHLALNIWCPLVDTGPENGWLQVIKGSHHFNRGLRPPTGLQYPELEAEMEARYLSPLPLRAGQAVLMHPCTIHGSVPNRSDRQRVVAAGVTAPREAQLYYCHQDWNLAPDRLEVYAVEEDFYLRCIVGTRPQGAVFIGAVPFLVDPVDQARLAKCCAALVSPLP